MRERDNNPEDGFLLIALVVAIFLILLALSVAAPRVAMQLKHERELETQHRANQYVRAIRVYYRKFGSYPGSMEALKKSNNQRFLRQEYVDPLTGEKDWKLIRVGQNKTKVKGFFGEDLPGLSGGLGALAGSASSGQGGGFGSSASGSGATAGSGFGSTTTPTNTTGQGATMGSTGVGSGSTTTSGAGFGQSTLAGTGGPFMGVGVPKDGESMLTVNEQNNYQDWEFLYDPRIEQMYAKANLLGGGIASSSGGLGTLGGSTSSGQGTTTPTSATPASPASPVTTPQ